MSDNWADFQKKMAVWESLGGKLPVQQVPSKVHYGFNLSVEDDDPHTTAAALEGIAIARFAEMGISICPDVMIKQAAYAMALKGGFIVFRFTNETVVTNLERI